MYCLESIKYTWHPTWHSEARVNLPRQPYNKSTVTKKITAQTPKSPKTQQQGKTKKILFAVFLTSSKGVAARRSRRTKTQWVAASPGSESSSESPDGVVGVAGRRSQVEVAVAASLSRKGFSSQPNNRSGRERDLGQVIQRKSQKYPHFLALSEGIFGRHCSVRNFRPDPAPLLLPSSR